jgi:hypothetical protein
VTGNELDLRGLIPVWVTDSFFRQIVRTGFVTHPLSYPVNTGGTFTNDKTAEVRN